MKIYEIIFKIVPKGSTEVKTQAHYWSASSLEFAAQAAKEYADDLMELMSVKYILTVTKAVDEVPDE